MIFFVPFPCRVILGTSLIFSSVSAILKRGKVFSAQDVTVFYQNFQDVLPSSVLEIIKLLLPLLFQ